MLTGIAEILGHRTFGIAYLALDPPFDLFRAEMVVALTHFDILPL